MGIYDFSFRGGGVASSTSKSGPDEVRALPRAWLVRFTRVNVTIWRRFCWLRPGGVALSGIIHTICTAKGDNK